MDWWQLALLTKIVLVLDGLLSSFAVLGLHVALLDSNRVDAFHTLLLHDLVRHGRDFVIVSLLQSFVAFR